MLKEKRDPLYIPRYRLTLDWFASQLTAGVALLLGLVTAEVVFEARYLRESLPVLLLVSWLNTLLTWLLLSPWLLIVYFAAGLLSIPFSKRLLQLLIFLLFFMHLVLTNYFSKALVPLGAELYGHTWSELRETLREAGWEFIIVVLVTGLILWALLRWTGKSVVHGSNPKAWPALVITITGLVLTFIRWHGITYGDSEYVRNLTMDKTGYFLRETWHYLFH